MRISYRYKILLIKNSPARDNLFQITLTFKNDCNYLLFLPEWRKMCLLLSWFPVKCHRNRRSQGGSEWQGVMKTAGEMVLPLCHQIRPLNDSSWCQALRNTGNESHPRELAPAGGFKKGPEKAVNEHLQFIFSQWEGMQQCRDASLFFSFFKLASPPRMPVVCM